MLDFLVVIVNFYRHLYRQKPSAFIGAGDALGLRGDYFSTSIINYRRELEARRSHCILRFFLQGTSIKQRLLVTKRYIASVFRSLLTFYAQFISHKNTNLPPNIIYEELGARTSASTIRR
jgi:hypothetical protein